jgi:hypothetical protein
VRLVGRAQAARSWQSSAFLARKSLQPFLQVGNFICWRCRRGPGVVHRGKIGQGDELKVCAQEVETAKLNEREKEWPKAFDSKQGVLVVLRREKK